MTNEEKASYIARELVNMGVRGKFDIANKAAIMMAEWKDKQYQSEIDGSSVKNDSCWINLGLPSGTLWSDRNVGAETIEDNGKYLSFSEAQKHGNVPTKEQFQELIEECKWNWKGKGYEVVGTNGNSIYLPVAGFSIGIDVYSVGLYGYYWSSSADNNNYADFMYFSDTCVYIFNNYRHYGLSVRLVK